MSTSAGVPVALVDDSMHERSNETLTVELTNPMGAVFGNSSNDYEEDVTIVDDDPVPVLSVETKSLFVNEGGDVSIILRLSNPTYQDVVFTYSTVASGTEPADGGTLTATDGSDDFPIRMNLTQPMNSPNTSGEIAIPINTDSVYEGNETFDVNITAVSNATFQDNVSSITVPITIVDDETKPTLALNSATEIGHVEDSPNLNVRFRLSGTTDKPVVVTPSIVTSGTTADSNDYGAWNTTVATIMPGDRDGSVTLPITNDSNYEDNETINFELTVDNNATIPNTAGKYAISVTLQDDEGPVISVDADTLMVSETAGKTRVLLTLDKVAGSAIDVGFTATTESGDTAESGGLYRSCIRCKSYICSW